MTMSMSEKNNNSVWTDTRGIAEHFDMKPNTLRKAACETISNNIALPS